STTPRRSFSSSSSERMPSTTRSTWPRFNMRIRPIRTDRDHEEAVARVEEILAAKPGTPEFDELDVLATLVDAYEREHHPIDPPSPVQAIKFRMEQGQFTRAELAKLLGSSAKVAEVLQRKRA